MSAIILYRQLWRQAKPAVNSSKPATLLIRKKISEAFRKCRLVQDPITLTDLFNRGNNTLEFLSAAAAERNQAHLLLKNLCKIYLNREKRTKPNPLAQKAQAQVDRLIQLLNETMKLALP